MVTGGAGFLGSQTRSFCQVDDFMLGLIGLFNSTSPSSPINLGNPGPISMFQLANEIIELTNSDSEIEFLPLSSDDPKQRVPDISRARELFDWAPSVSRLDGLARTTAYFSSIREVAVEG